MEVPAASVLAFLGLFFVILLLQWMYLKRPVEEGDELEQGMRAHGPIQQILQANRHDHLSIFLDAGSAKRNTEQVHKASATETTLRI
jgi:hypothetical protein